MKAHHIQQFGFDKEKLTIEWGDEHRSQFHYEYIPHRVGEISDFRF